MNVFEQSTNILRKYETRSILYFYYFKFDKDLKKFD